MSALTDNTILENAGQISTSGQMRKLKNPEKRIVWAEVDISNAIDIYAAGAKAYRNFTKKGYPLPSGSTFRR